MDERETGLFTDRIPPHNLEAEQAVLGAILLENEAIAAAMEHVTPDDFYRAAHQRIFEAMVQLSEESEPVDLVTLSTRLKDQGLLEEVGGIGYLTELANSVPTAANVAYYARIIEEKAMLRRLIRTATQSAACGCAAAEGVRELMVEAEGRILEICNRRGEGFGSIRDVLVDVFERVE